MSSVQNAIFTKHDGIRHIRDVFLGVFAFVHISVTCNFTGRFLKILCTLVIAHTLSLEHALHASCVYFVRKTGQKI